MDELDFGDFDFGDFDLSGVDFSGLSDVDMSGIDFGDFDLSGLSGLEGLDLSGLEGMDLSSVDLGDLKDLNLDSSMLEGVDPSLLESLGLSQPEGEGEARSLARSLFGGDTQNTSGADDSYSPRIQQNLDDLIAARTGEGGGGAGNDGQKFDSAEKSNAAEESDKYKLNERSARDPELTRGGLRKDGLGFTATGRGQLSMRDPETGTTGLTAEGFTSVKDLLGSGTAEEIARYTPGSADYSLRSGLETKEGQGLTADATRGMGLDFMGGGQGLSKYVPAEYAGSVLEDLVDRNPGKFDSIEDYLNKEMFGGKSELEGLVGRNPGKFKEIEEYLKEAVSDKGGTTPFKGTGGTLSQAGFLSQSSAANPLGAQYAIGNPKSFINNPAVTGQQAAVSPNRTVIDNKDGTFKVVTEKDGQITTRVEDDKGKVISEKTTTAPKTSSPSDNKTGEKKDDWMKYIMLLMALDAMRNKGDGKSGAVIPSLTASRGTTPYAEIQKAPGYRPGQGGVQYFGPTVYRAAGGGIGSLDAAGGRLLRGPGDGVSDNIVAQIGNSQPARLADGEYVLDARTVSEIGNGSTDAGADKIAQMVERIHGERRNAKRGEPSNADKKLLA